MKKLKLKKYAQLKSHCCMHILLVWVVFYGRQRIVLALKADDRYCLQRESAREGLRVRNSKKPWLLSGHTDSGVDGA